MRADEHLSQFCKVAVILIVDFDGGPWITAAANFFTVVVDHLLIGANNSKGDFGDDVVIFSNCLFVVKLILRTFEDFDVVMIDVIENLVVETSDGLATAKGWGQNSLVF